MAKSRVLIVGATGETGGSILEGLLESGETHVEILVRPASAEKPSVSKLKERGITVHVGNLNDDLVNILAGIDTVICALGSSAQLEQISLVDAAQKAGVKRFVPCGFITAAPPGGVMKLRDEKEVVYQHVRKSGLPYTMIDVGYWYQLSFPTLPSGRVNYASLLPSNVTIFGDEKTRTAITDLRDVGKFVARIVTDERTVNKYVFCYGEVLPQQKIFSMLEEISGEQVERIQVSAEQLQSFHVATKAQLESDPGNLIHAITLTGLEYCHSKFIRGDNTPEYAEDLGYLDARELYPDFTPRSYRAFLEELLEGKVVRPYAGLSL